MQAGTSGAAERNESRAGGGVSRMVPARVGSHNGLMSKRSTCLLAGTAALLLYGAGYLVALSFVWAVPVAERYGLEWLLVFLMTLPWSLAAGHRMWIVHLGAVTNGLLFALVVASITRRLATVRPSWG